jgi:hypothetical protein
MAKTSSSIQPFSETSGRKHNLGNHPNIVTIFNVLANLLIFLVALLERHWIGNLIMFATAGTMDVSNFIRLLPETNIESHKQVRQDNSRIWTAE